MATPAEPAVPEAEEEALVLEDGEDEPAGPEGEAPQQKPKRTRRSSLTKPMRRSRR